MNLPNKISIFRILLVPILVVLLEFPFSDFEMTIPVIWVANAYIPMNYFIAGIVFIVGSLSDFLDGYIARKYDMVTAFGKFIDPVSDKLLVNSTLIMLIGHGFISPVVGVIMIGRDIIVDVVRMISAEQNIVIAAGIYGKLKTVFQMLALTLFLFYNVPFEIWGIRMANILLFVAVIFSIISGYIYVRKFSVVLYHQDNLKEVNLNEKE